MRAARNSLGLGPRSGLTYSRDWCRLRSQPGSEFRHKRAVQARKRYAESPAVRRSVRAALLPLAGKESAEGRSMVSSLLERLPGSKMPFLQPERSEAWARRSATGYANSRRTRPVGRTRSEVLRSMLKPTPATLRAEVTAYIEAAGGFVRPQLLASALACQARAEAQGFQWDDNRGLWAYVGKGKVKDWKRYKKETNGRSATRPATSLRE